MRQSPHRNILTQSFIVIFLFNLASKAHAQYYMSFFKNNGEKVKISVTELDSVNFSKQSESVPVYYLNAYHRDGKRSHFPVSDLDSILYEKITDPSNGHEYVDLGLSVCWATCNVGAEKYVEDYGDYYAWGETESKNDYSWASYKYSNIAGYVTKYNGNSIYGYNGYVDNKKTLDPVDDVAHVKWGGDWRMPTKSEFEELINNCNWTWSVQNGVAGYTVTSNLSGYKQRSIFLPAGIMTGENQILLGNYWSSSINVEDSRKAWELQISSEQNIIYERLERYRGFSVRPVFPSIAWENKEIRLDIDVRNLTVSINDSAVIGIHILKGSEDVCDLISPIEVIWSSDNESVATVSSEGMVTGLSIGTATITATCQGKSKKCVVRVVDLTPIGYDNSYGYVDLGLSVYWATYNMGAAKPEEYGDYYTWGELEPYYESGFAQEDEQTHWKENYYGYYWGSYKWYSSTNELTKYNTNSDNGVVDNKTILGPGDDVAHMKWGRNWHMPTEAEFEELRTNCTWTSTTYNGVKGYLISSKKNGYTNCSIFLPAAGYRDYTDLEKVGSCGYYWSSTLAEDTYNAHYVYAQVSSSGYLSTILRYHGLSVRPVSPTDEWLSHISLSLPHDSITILQGCGCLLTAMVNYDGMDCDYSCVCWSSDNPSVVKVSNEGVVTTHALGKATITASIKNKTVTCLIKVIDETEIEHEYVDLGLSVNWATFNVGASNEEGWGDYFAWGEIEPYYEMGYAQSYDPVWKTGKSDGYYSLSYKYCNDYTNQLTKYCINPQIGYKRFVDNKITLDPDDDVAHIKWGGNWRIPAEAENDELRNNCTWIWTSVAGVSGYRVISNIPGYEDRSIFLPASGYRNGTDIIKGCGVYWSNNINSGENIHILFFNSEKNTIGSYGRFSGCSVRPVCPSDEWLSSAEFCVVEHEKTLLNGDSDWLNVKVKRNGEFVDYPPVIWYSDNPIVAAVDQSGKVTAKSTGIAHITASIQSLSTQFTVTVIDGEHEYVDLGLSVMWATHNVGATDYNKKGDYYSWGNIRSQESYSWGNDTFHISGSFFRNNGKLDENIRFSKYITESKHGFVDNKTTLDLEDDVANYKWGGNWRMPTREEWNELLNNCTWTWTGGGYQVTSKKNGYTDRSIFLPCVGMWDNSSYYSNSTGYYWSSSLATDHSVFAASFEIKSNNRGIIYHYRSYGFSVRPVCPLGNISFNKDTTILGVGYNDTLDVLIKQKSGVQEIPATAVTWSSDNPSVAVVDPNGKVTALSAGTANITALIQSQSCQSTVIVIDESEKEHDFVDLGLSVKWATSNIGAESPVNYGDYYAWGETETKSTYSWSTYKWCNGSHDSLTKYNTSSSYGIVDDKTTLDPEDDVAHVKWGDNWRMPTEVEIIELLNNCTWTWITQDGVNGYILTSTKPGYTDRSIFLPSAGYRMNDSAYDVGSSGMYWHSSLATGFPYHVASLVFGSYSPLIIANSRIFGQSVRPVCP